MLFSYEKIEDFLSMQIDFICLMKIKNPRKRLRGKKKDFFIQCVKLSIDGIDFNSTDSTEYLRDYMGFNSSDDVYVYKSQLKRDGWLTRTPTKTQSNRIYKIHPQFDFYSKKFEPRKTYKFSIEYDQKVENQAGKASSGESSEEIPDNQ